MHSGNPVGSVSCGVSEVKISFIIIGVGYDLLDTVIFYANHIAFAHGKNLNIFAYISIV